MSGDDWNFAARLPSPPLRPYISYYIGFRAAGLEPAAHSGLPSRHLMLSIHLDPPTGVAAMSAHVSGLQTGPSLIRYGERRDGIFVALKPTGARSILGLGSPEFSARTIDLADLWGGAAGWLTSRLAEAKTWRGRLAILDEVFLGALRPRELAPELAWAWKRLAETNGCIPIALLSAKAGWSRQHLRERFHSELGVTPKTAARIFRFERAVSFIKQPRPNLAGIAAECGYHDQAHMTNEWNALAGCSPGEWIARELPFFQYSVPSGGD